MIGNAATGPKDLNPMSAPGLFFEWAGVRSVEDPTYFGFQDICQVLVLCLQVCILSLKFSREKYETTVVRRELSVERKPVIEVEARLGNGRAPLQQLTSTSVCSRIGHCIFSSISFRSSRF